MKRRLLKLLVGASLLLLIATTAIYIRSFYVCDFLACEEPGEDFLIHDYGTSRGGVFIVEDIGGVHFLNGEEDDGPTPTSRR